MVNWQDSLVALHKDGRRQLVLLKSGVPQPDKEGKYTVIGLPERWHRFNADGTNGARACHWTIENELPLEKETEPTRSNKIRKLKGLRLSPIFKSSDEPKQQDAGVNPTICDVTSLLEQEISLLKEKPLFSKGDRVYYIPRPSWVGEISHIEEDKNGFPRHFVLFDDFDRHPVFVRGNELDFVQNLPEHVEAENKDQVDMADAIVTTSIEGGAWGVRKDNSEEIYFPKSVRESADLHEFDEVKVILVYNNYPNPKWKAIKAKLL